MTIKADGKVVCDRCGADCGNGGVYESLVVTDLNMDSTEVVNYHFCRDHYGPDGKKDRTGCDHSVLTARNTQHWLESRDKYARPSLREPLVEVETKPKSRSKSKKEASK